MNDTAYMTETNLYLLDYIKTKRHKHKQPHTHNTYTHKWGTLSFCQTIPLTRLWLALHYNRKNMHMLVQSDWIQSHMIQKYAAAASSPPSTLLLSLLEKTSPTHTCMGKSVWWWWWQQQWWWQNHGW